MFERTELEQWLIKVGSNVGQPTHVYLIGGCAISFKGYKQVTKDIDMVALSKSDFKIIDNAIKSSGFKLTTDFDNEFYLTALAVYLKDDSRIDLFLKSVGRMLEFTEKMKARSVLYKTFGKLKVMLASNEDVFVFKSMTPRAGDILDCITLITHGINWNIVYDEIASQSKGDNKWFFWTYEKICGIENTQNIIIPIIILRT
ncbi:hypothetical protein HYU06_05495 [Candidatus Woesearchaeota archaeon]|nr:hypothetical protein [Candidatus Woesearchaeota archaeon]